MVVGMLWYDGDRNSNLSIKVTRAVEYYRHKYGRSPELCFVNPKLMETRELSVSGVEVRPNQQVLPNHFWLGFHTPSDRK